MEMYGLIHQPKKCYPVYNKSGVLLDLLGVYFSSVLPILNLLLKISMNVQILLFFFCFFLFVFLKNK